MYAWKWFKTFKQGQEYLHFESDRILGNPCVYGYTHAHNTWFFGILFTKPPWYSSAPVCFSYFLISGINISHGMAASIKKLILTKFLVSPKNQGLEGFPEPVGHFGAPWWPFLILQVVQCGRRWVTTRLTARLVFWFDKLASCMLFNSRNLERIIGTIIFWNIISLQWRR